MIFVHYHMTRPTERTSPSFSTEGPAFDAQFQPHAEAVCLGHDHSTLDVSRGRRYVNPGALGTDHNSSARFSFVDSSRLGVRGSMQQIGYDCDSVLRDLEGLYVPDRKATRRLFFGVS